MTKGHGKPGDLPIFLHLRYCFIRIIETKIGTVPIYGVFLLLLAGLAAGSAQAQQTDPAKVYAAFARLLGKPQDRAFFGLPEDRSWRAPGSVPLSLYAEYPDRPAGALRDAAAALGRAAGVTLDVVAVRPLDILRDREAFGLQIVLGPRPDLARTAARAKANADALGGFEAGHWPFIFHFPRGAALLGQVWIAEDEAPAAIEAALILACVWALGGVTLGEELEGLIDPAAGQPALTPLGAAVFALLYHPEIAAGLPLDQAKARARRLLGLAE